MQVEKSATEVFVLVVGTITPGRKEQLKQAIDFRFRGADPHWLEGDEAYVKYGKSVNEDNGNRQFIFALDETASAELNHLLDQDYYKITAEFLQLDKPAYQIKSLCGAFALGLKIAQLKSKHISLIMNLPKARIALSWLKDFIRPMTLFTAYQSVDRICLQIAQKDHHQHGFIDDRQAHLPQLIDDPSTRWESYGLDRKREFIHLIEQEFITYESETVFFDLCQKVFRKHQDVCVPYEYFIALRVLRLCRRMVTWILEGTPFRCTVLLATDQAFRTNSYGENPLAKLFRFEPIIPFDFQHLTEIRNRAEMVQSEGMLLHVGMDDQCLKNIAIYSTASCQKQGLSRREVMERLTDIRETIVIHMHAGHIVEVYGDGRWCLWFDGFCWQLPPIDVVEYICRKHFCTAEVSEREGEANKGQLLRTISSLLELQKSSIIVLLSRLDEKRFDFLVSIARKVIPMRSGITADFGQTSDTTDAINVPSIRAIPMDSLVGLLKLDGSHVINQEGKLQNIAHRIQSLGIRETPIVSGDRVRIEEWINQRSIERSNATLDPEAPTMVLVGNLQDRDWQELERLSLESQTLQQLQQLRETPNELASQSDVSGTGTAAAQELSRFLTFSFIIKVSASGSIKPFQKGELVKRPASLPHFPQT